MGKSSHLARRFCFGYIWTTPEEGPGISRTLSLLLALRETHAGSGTYRILQVIAAQSRLLD